MTTKKKEEELDEFKDYDPNKELNPRQMEFAYLYFTGKKGVKYNAMHAYAQAYDLEPSVSTSVMGGRLLNSVKVRKFQRFLNHIAGLTHETVDNRLLDLIMNSDGRTSVSAIRQYNLLNNRIKNTNVDVKVDANKLLDQLKQAKTEDNY